MNTDPVPALRLEWPSPIARAESDRPTAIARWNAAWSALGATRPPLAERDRLLARYAEPQRAYHTRQHLDECLHLLAAVRALCPHPDEVALALWFHDAVYEPRGADNEAQSAAWLARLAAELNVPDAITDRLHAPVMSTCHTSAPHGPDACTLLDIDLAILGAPRERFDEYEHQIRREYRWVPGPVYRGQRARVLERFLARASIYSTAAFKQRFEPTARDNIARSLALLRARP